MWFNLFTYHIGCTQGTFGACRYAIKALILNEFIVTEFTNFKYKQ